MSVKQIDCPMCYNKSRVSCEEEDPKLNQIGKTILVLVSH